MSTKRPGSPLPEESPAKQAKQDIETLPDQPAGESNAVPPQQEEDDDTPLRDLPAISPPGSALRPLRVRPIPTTDNGARLSADQWEQGFPWPKGSRMQYFRRLGRRLHPITLNCRNLTKLVLNYEKGIEKKTLLPGVTFLSPMHTSVLYPQWVAALVKLRSVFQLNTFLDRDVARVAHDLVRLHNLTDKRKRAPNTKDIIQGILHVNGIYPDLRTTLERNPGTLVRGSAHLDLIPFDEIAAVTLDDIDIVASYIATLYRLLTSFPKFFRGHSAKGPASIWGHTHDNWQAAFVVFEAFRDRRRKSLDINENPDSKEAQWYGLITDDDATAAQARIHEADAPPPVDAGASQSELTDVARPEDVALALALPTIRTRDNGHEVPKDGQPGVLDRIVDLMSEMNKLVNEQDFVASKYGQRLTLEESTLLRTELQNYSRVKYDPSRSIDDGLTAPATAEGGSSSSPGNAAHLQALEQGQNDNTTASTRPQTEEVAAITEGGEHDAETDAEDKVEHDEQQSQLIRQLMGTFPAREKDLAEVCRQIGIQDWRHLRMQEMRPSAPQAKPHQVIGAWSIYQRLTSPIRAAILADECGVGKTLQIGMALAISCRLAEEAYASGCENVSLGERKYKPSVILCPPNVIYQIFRELFKWFGDFLIIKVSYGTECSCTDAAMSKCILKENAKVQKWIDDCATDHENPKTAIHRLVSTESEIVNKDSLTDEAGNACGPSQNEKARGSTGTGGTRNDNGASKKQKIKDKKVFVNLKNTDFNWIIIDEGHEFRNPWAAKHKMVQTLPRDGILIVTATPILNRLIDARGYAKLIWRPEWPFKYETDGDIDIETVYDRGTWEAIKNGQAVGGLNMERLISDTEGRQSANASMSPRARQLRDEYVAFIQGKTDPLFFFHPQMVLDFGEHTEHGEEFAIKTVNPLLKMICLRRLMHSQLTLPDGTMASPGATMPPLTVQTVELEPSAALRDEMSQHLEQHARDLSMNTKNKLPQHVGHRVIQQGEKSRINNTVLRILRLMTTHPSFYLLTQPSVRNIRLLLGQAVSRVQASDGPPATVMEVKEIVETDGTGGLRWYFHLTRQSDEEQYPQSKLDMVKMVCAGSPKFAWTVQRVVELCRQGKRVLIYVNHPVTSMLLNALFNYLNIRSLNVRCTSWQPDRVELIRRFNDPTSHVKVLITSFQVGAFGVNYHAVCHHGIILEYPQNLPTLMHAIGRLWRIGQSHPVHWDIVYLRQSFDASMEFHMTQKYAEVLAVEGQIPVEIRGDNRLICAYAITGKYLGTQSSRFPREKVPLLQRDSDLAIREGKFYAAAGEFMMAHPDSNNKFTKGSMPRIALS
ncbi:hypothetical protein ACJZ2D_011821 [Fusarium nematophilum]